MFTKGSSKRAGFTLVEILVVLAIVALLGALLLGVFARVREKGRSATCQSNLHQIALAMQQYVGDNDGIFPALIAMPDKGTPNSEAILWREAIMPYAKSLAIFYCPTSESRLSASERLEYPPGYGYNFLDLNGRDKKLFGLHESNFAALSDVVLNLDDPVLSSDDDSFLFGKEIETACGPQAVVDDHSGGANFSYADGHVKWLTPQQQGEWICGVNERQQAKKESNP